MSGIEWRTSKQVAARIHLNICTIRRRAEAGILHGHQTGPGAPWLFADAAVDAHVQGHDDRAQREACGCARLRAVRRTG